MARVAYYYDSSKCVGCHGCQITCKQWNQEKTVKTHFKTGYGNPPVLDPDTRMIMKYYEGMEKETNPVNLNFLKYQCFHCGDPACVKVCPSGCLSKTATGIVAVDQEKCIACGYCHSACPFAIPMIGKNVNKCDMCRSRTEQGNDKDMSSTPACVKTCPAHAMEYGDRDAMLAKANKRVEWLKSRGHKDANVYGGTVLGGLGIIPVLKYAPEHYGLPANPTVPTEVTVWKDIFNPLGLLMLAGAFGMTVVHRIMQRGKDDGHSTDHDTTGSGKEDIKG